MLDLKHVMMETLIHQLVVMEIDQAMLADIIEQEAITLHHQHELKFEVTESLLLQKDAMTVILLTQMAVAQHVQLKLVIVALIH